MPTPDATASEFAPGNVAAQGLGTAERPISPPPATPRAPREIGGPPGPEPTRFGDWEKAGRCIDF